MNSKIKSLIQYIVFLALGIIILYLSYNNFSAAYIEECHLKGIPESECSLIQKLFDDFKSVNFFWIVLISIIFMISNVFRALRWKQLLEPLGYKPAFINALGATMIGYLANLGFPRVGEIVKPGILTKYDNIPLEKGIGTIVVDRILDIISLLFIIGLAVLLSFETFQEYFEANFSIARAESLKIFLILAFVGLLGLMSVNWILKRSNSKNKLVLLIQSLWTGFVEGLVSIKKVKNLPLLISYTILIWLMYYLMTYLCFFAFAPTANLGMTTALIVFVFGTLGIVFPSPGGMGSYHFLVSQALIIYGLSSADAFSFSNIIFFTIQIFGNIFFGILFLVILPIVNKKSS